MPKTPTEAKLFIVLARIGAILASALLLALYSRVEYPSALLGWVALVPWLISLERERALPAALGNGAVMSMAFAVGVFGWFADAFARYTATPLWLAAVVLIVSAPFLQPQFMVFAAVRRGLATRGASGLIVSVSAALVWVGVEWVCPRLFGETLGHGLLPFPTLRQGADLAGAPGLTFVLLVVNQEIHAVGMHWRRSRILALRSLLSAALLTGALAGYGAVRLQQVNRWEPTQQPLTVALIQADLDDYSDLRSRLGTFTAARRIIDTHIGLSARAIEDVPSPGQVDLVVWPETAYPTTFGTPKSAAGADLDASIVEFAARMHGALLFGTYVGDDAGEYNAAVLLQSRGDPRGGDAYRKRRLFPLTESVPRWLESESLRSHLPWLGTWRPGDGPALLTLSRGHGDVAFAPLICLDAVDPMLAIDAARRGAQLIVTLSNDGWFADGAGAQLHLAVSAFRSIETRLPQLRATNTGISAVIGADGEILARAAVGESTALMATVAPGMRRETLMLWWGNWFGLTACLLAPLLALLAVRLGLAARKSPAEQ